MDDISMPFYYGHVTLLKALYAFQGAPLWSRVAGTNTVNNVCTPQILV